VPGIREKLPFLFRLFASGICIPFLFPFFFEPLASFPDSLDPRGLDQSRQTHNGASSCSSVPRACFFRQRRLFLFALPVALFPHFDSLSPKRISTEKTEVTPSFAQSGRARFSIAPSYRLLFRDWSCFSRTLSPLRAGATWTVTVSDLCGSVFGPTVSDVTINLFFSHQSPLAVTATASEGKNIAAGLARTQETPSLAL